MVEIALQQGRGAGAVDVVVAEDRDPLAVPDRARDALAGLVHVGDRQRVRHQVADGRIHEPLRRLRADVASGQNARDDVGYAVSLRDGERDVLLALAQAMLPGDARGGGADTEEEAGGLWHRANVCIRAALSSLPDTRGLQRKHQVMARDDADPPGTTA